MLRYACCLLVPLLGGEALARPGEVIPPRLPVIAELPYRYEEQLWQDWRDMHNVAEKFSDKYGERLLDTYTEGLIRSPGRFWFTQYPDRWLERSPDMRLPPYGTQAK
jgi:hypothetical protein